MTVKSTGRTNPKEPLELLAFGETMLRFTPPDFSRFEQASNVEMHIGGSESNTCVGLARLGHYVGWLSRMTNNPLGHTIVRGLAAHGVDVSSVQWSDADRVGIYFMERGSPPRGSQVFYDRAESAMSLMRPEDFPTDAIEPGLKIFHTTGITLGISGSAAETAMCAAKLAKRCGAEVSFDVNYRHRLWEPGPASRRCDEMCRQADLIFLPARDAQHLFGTGGDPKNSLRQLQKRWPGRNIVMTIGSRGSVAVDQSGCFFEQPAVPVHDIERLGRGDAFSAGFLSARLRKLPLDKSLAWASTAAALKCTIPGDLPIWDANMIESLIENQSTDENQVQR